MRIIYIYVPGILSLPGKADAWTDKAVTWTHIHTQFYAEKFEYFSNVFTRRIRQAWRAEKLSNMLGYYQAAGWTIRLCGHSNGCDVILRALKMFFYRVDELHLISPACDANQGSNRLSYYMASEKVRRLCIYVAGQDRALQLARRTEPILALFGMGYGWLGALPADVLEASYGPDATIISEPEYGHSEWFDDDERSAFNFTMKRITKGK